jgi:hypothetical protein
MLDKIVVQVVVVELIQLDLGLMVQQALLVQLLFVIFLRFHLQLL